MCFAFVTYYPRVDDLDQCVQFAEYDVCGQQGGMLCPIVFTTKFQLLLAWSQEDEVG